MLYLEYNYTLEYICESGLHILNTADGSENKHLSVDIQFEEKKLKLIIFPKKPIKLLNSIFTYKYNFEESDKFFVNGFQSWTDTKEFVTGEKIKRFPFFAKILNPLFKLSKYGDLEIFKKKIKKNSFYGFDFVYIKKDEQYYFLVSKIPEFVYTIFDFEIEKNSIEIHSDIENLEINKETKIIDVEIFDNITYSEIEQYFRNKYSTKNQRITGWTSWYNYYQKIDNDIIFLNIDNFSKYYPEGSIFQIDDGYQKYVGDWLDIDLKKFPKGIAQFPERLHQKAYLAGLWLAPFAAQKNSKLAKEHPNWFIKDKADNFLQGGANWGGFYALDIYNEEFRNYLQKVFDTVLNKWNFDMVKLDFLYAAAISPRAGKTRAQIMTDAINFLRELVGNKLILACGVPLAQSFGKVDYCRIGADIGLNWNGKFYEKWLHRERVSTNNTLLNTVFRRILDKSVFLNDPDVFLLRDDNIKLTKNQRITTYLLNSIFGSLIFTSDDFSKYEDWQMKLLKNLSFFVKADVLSTEFEDKLLKFSFKIDDIIYMAISNLGKKKLQFDFKNKKKFNIFNLNFTTYNKNIINEFETVIYEK